MAGGEPSVVAHRGASLEAPEHTLAAYQLAIDGGADGLECDVRMTRDGALVCVHDRRVERTSHRRAAVSALALSELAGVLTLDQLLELVVETPRRVELAIETKYPTRYAGRLERAVHEQLLRFGLAGGVDPGPVRVMSFAAASLRRFQALAPEIPQVLLFPRLHVRLRDGRLPAPVGIAGPSIGLLRRNPWYVARAHDAGHQVHVWTVDAAADVELVRSLGVDAIITNRPREVLALLGRGPG